MIISNSDFNKKVINQKKEYSKWQEENPILLNGEIVADENNNIYIGDGKTEFKNLIPLTDQQVIRYKGRVSIAELNSFTSGSQDNKLSVQQGDMFTISDIEKGYLNLGIQGYSLQLQEQNSANKQYVATLSVDNTQNGELLYIPKKAILLNRTTNDTSQINYYDFSEYNYFYIADIKKDTTQSVNGKHPIQIWLNYLPINNSNYDTTKPFSINNNVFCEIAHNDEVIWTGDHWELINYSQTNDVINPESYLVGKVYYYKANDDDLEETQGGEIFNVYEPTSYPEGSNSKQPNTAKGRFSHAEGYAAHAEGDCSHTEGSFTTAFGRYSHAEGHDNTTNGDGSHVEGCYNRNHGNYSHVEGGYNKIEAMDDTYANHIEGYQNILQRGLGNHVEGGNNIVNWGDYGHIEGESNINSGNCNHVEGNQNYNYGSYNHIEGSLNNIEYAKGGLPITFEYEKNDSNNSPILRLIIQDNESQEIYTKLTNLPRGGFEGFFIINNTFISSMGGSPGSTYSSIWINCKSQSSMIFHTASNNIVIIYSPGTLMQDLYLNQAFDIKQTDTTFSKENKGYLLIKEAELEKNFLEFLKQKNYIEPIVSQLNAHSHFEGKENLSQGENNHLSGYQNYIAGQYNHIENSGNVIVGKNCHAEGNRNQIFGENCHAEGTLNTITPNRSYSHIEGMLNTINHNYCHVEGEWNTTTADYQHIEGKYNDTSKTEECLHIVGNGTEEKRSNAYTLDRNGNAWFAGNIVFNGKEGNGISLVETIESAIQGFWFPVYTDEIDLEQQGLTSSKPYKATENGWLHCKGRQATSIYITPPGAENSTEFSLGRSGDSALDSLFIPIQTGTQIAIESNNYINQIRFFPMGSKDDTTNQEGESN